MRWAVICVAALWLGCVLIVQQPGCSENGHYALVRSLADGSPSIDRYHWWTCDVSYYRGHFYTAKGPGLAAAALPVLYIVRVVSNVGHVPAFNGPPLSPAPKRAIWPLEAMIVLTSGILLFLLMRYLAEAVVPGVGTIVAFVLTAGTMLLPYSTLFASHVPSAMLGTAAFVLLFRERRASSASWKTLAAAGALAGASIVVEPPMGLVTLALIGYTLVRERGWQRPIAYIGGAFVGVLPLLIFDHWAFGSITHTPYSDTVSISGDTGHDQLGANQNGFFGIAAPSLSVAAKLLLLNKGLFVATPVVLAALAGVWWLSKESAFRAEAWLISGLAVAYLVYNAAYYQPYGGDSAGPRFLIPLLPFLALPLALVVERLPGVFAALGLISVGTMLTATLTFPMLDGDNTKDWFSRAIHGRFQETLLGSHAAAMVPSALLLVGAAVAAVVGTRWPKLGRGDATAAVLVLFAWAILGSSTPPLLHSGLPTGVAAVLALAVLAAVVAGTVVGIRRLNGEAPAGAGASA